MRKHLLLLLVGVLWALPSFAVEVRPDKAVTITFDENSDVSDNSPNVDGVSCGLVWYSHDDDMTGSATDFAGVIESSADGSTWATAITLVDGDSGFLPQGRNLFRINPSTAPGTGDKSLTIFRCQEDLSSVPLAPGVEGSFATLDTLRWIWGLDHVPFPETIDDGQWTDYYFSEAGETGLWAAGNDANDCTSIEAACDSIDRAKAICFAGSYRRCNFDPGDTWDVAGGWDNGFGAIEDSDLTVTGCPTGIINILAQPCFWLRGNLGGSGAKATLDATGSLVSDRFIEFGPVTDRSHLLVEGFSLVCDTGAGSSACIDNQGAGIITGVGNDMDVSDNITGSGNVVASHDFGVTHIYGNGTWVYSGTATGTNTPFGTQDAGVLAIHTSQTIPGAASANCGIALMTQDGGSGFDASLATEVAAHPGYGLLTGAHLQPCVTASAAVPIAINATDTFGNSDRYNLDTISLFLDPQSTATNPIHVQFYGTWTADTEINVRMLYTSFGTSGAAAGDLHVLLSDGVMDDGSLLNLTLVSSVYETAGAAPQAIRLIDDSWADGTAGSVLTLVDTIYDSFANGWRITSASGDCLDATPEDLASCANALRTGAVVVDGANIHDATGTWYSTEGYCDPAGECFAAATGAISYYTFQFDYRGAIPAFIAGRKLTGFRGHPEVDTNLGRQRPEPYGPR